MFRKLGLYSILFAYTTVAMVKAQEIQLRSLKMPNPECVNKLSAQPADCCKMPEIFDESIIKKCFADFGSDGPPPAPAPGVPPPGCCVAECILNTTKIIVDGKYDQNQALTIIKETVKDAKWFDITKAALQTCEKEQNEIMAKMPGPLPPSDLANRKCSPIPAAMIACVKANMFQNCPDYGTDAKCVTLKTEIVTCPMALMKKP